MKKVWLYVLVIDIICLICNLVLIAIGRPFWAGVVIGTIATVGTIFALAYTRNTKD